MTSEAQTSLLEFPCSFPIKAMGRQTDEFEQLVTAIIFRHALLFEGETISTIPSKAGNYISVTAVIEATSQQQLDAIYLELTASELVLMAL